MTPASRTQLEDAISVASNGPEEKADLSKRIAVVLVFAVIASLTISWFPAKATAALPLWTGADIHSYTSYNGYTSPSEPRSYDHDSRQGIILPVSGRTVYPREFDWYYPPSPQTRVLYQIRSADRSTVSTRTVESAFGSYTTSGEASAYRVWRYQGRERLIFAYEQGTIGSQPVLYSAVDVDSGDLVGKLSPADIRAFTGLPNTSNLEGQIAASPDGEHIVVMLNAGSSTSRPQWKAYEIVLGSTGQFVGMRDTGASINSPVSSTSLVAVTNDAFYVGGFEAEYHQGYIKKFSLASGDLLGSVPPPVGTRWYGLNNSQKAFADSEGVWLVANTGTTYANAYSAGLKLLKIDPARNEVVGEWDISHPPATPGYEPDGGREPDGDLYNQTTVAYGFDPEKQFWLVYNNDKDTDAIDPVTRTYSHKIRTFRLRLTGSEAPPAPGGPDPRPSPPAEKPFWEPATKHASAEEKTLAPLLRLASEERWKPLDVDLYFSSLTPRLNSAAFSDEAFFSGEGAMLAIPWKAVHENGPRGRGAAYVRELVPTGGVGYRWLSYNWYQSYNDGLPNQGEDPPQPWSCPSLLSEEKCTDHWSDWEGIALAVSVAPVGGRPDFDAAALYAHGHPYKYLPGTLTCGESKSRCSAVNPRINVYQSRGQHASYPTSCGTTVPIVGWSLCSQNDLPAGFEGVFDGKGDVYLTDASQTVFAYPTASDQWNNPKDDWGDASKWGPAGAKAVGSPSGSPTNAGSTPWRATCTGNTRRINRGKAPPTVIILPCAPSPGATASAAQSSPSQCGDWEGLMVQLAVCDEKRLQEAIDNGTLGQGSPIALAGPGAEDDAPGIAQSVGEPLRPGQTVTVTGPASSGAELVVRSQTRDSLESTTYKRLGLTGKTARLTVKATNGGPQVRDTGGRTLKPAASAIVDTRSLPALKIKSASLKGRRLLLVLAKRPGNPLEVRVLDKAGNTQLTKTVKAKTSRVTLNLSPAVASQAKTIIVAQLNKSEIAGKTSRRQISGAKP